MEKLREARIIGACKTLWTSVEIIRIKVSVENFRTRLAAVNVRQEIKITICENIGIILADNGKIDVTLEETNKDYVTWVMRVMM